VLSWRQPPTGGRGLVERSETDGYVQFVDNGLYRVVAKLKDTKKELWPKIDHLPRYHSTKQQAEYLKLPKLPDSDWGQVHIKKLAINSSCQMLNWGRDTKNA